MSKKIRISAPGKLMLLGEHAVVYNRPCLVTAVGQRMVVAIEIKDSHTFELEAPDVKVSGYTKVISDVGKGEIPKGAKFAEIAVKNFFEKNKIRDGLKITTRSEFSSQFGFGSSSASTVCVIKGLSELYKVNMSNKDIFDLAYKTVLDIQGKGSGFDIAAAVYGGTLHFVTGGKKIEKLSINKLPLIVGYSGLKADTVTLINKVAEKSKKYPEVIENSYNQIKKLVEIAKTYLIKEDLQSFGEVMNMNQGFLEVLGVNINKLSSMIYAARDAGAYGAKLSGAGGGDCMIAIAPEDKKQAVIDGIIQVGGQYVQVETNAEGLKVESLKK